MSFQILNKDNEPISIGELDKEAAEFWGKEVHSKNYANPRPLTGNSFKDAMNISSNWFDQIGHAIHSQGYECSGWSNVAATMIASMIGMKFIDLSHDYKTGPIVIKYPIVKDIDDKNIDINFADEVIVDIYGILEWVKPYINLMNYWQSKGYQPKQVKE